MSGRHAVALGAASLLAGTALAVAGPRPVHAATLDVSLARADASPVEMTMATAYSFFVNPDVQMPRATASIAAGRSSATASPADPGDDLDALGGIAVPMVEQTAIDQVRQGATGAPEPFKTVLNAAAGGLATVSTTTSPVTGLLDTQYEHVTASYPNGTGAATFGPDPSFADPTGLVAVQGAAGRVSAGSGAAIADAGGGMALATPLGVRIGRVSAHSETHSGSAKVTADAISEVSDVDLSAPAFPGLTLPSLPLPGGTALLHIGAVRTVLHSERVAGAAKATSASTVEATGVTVLGAPARLDETGLHLLSANVALQPVIDALDAALGLAIGSANSALPPSTPFGGHPVVPLGHLLGPTQAAATPHGADEIRQQAAGMALTVAGTVLVPSQIPPSTTGPPQLVAQPALITLTLASARTDAYGRSLPLLGPPPVSIGAGTISVAPGSSTGAATPVTAAPGATVAAPAGAPAPAPPASGPSGPVQAVEEITAALAGAPVPPGAVVLLAALAEALMLAALVDRYRRTRPRPDAPLPGPEELV